MTKMYFNAKSNIWDELIAEKDQDKLRILADRMDITRGATVLDVGTGTGVFVPFLLDKIGENGHLVCLDFAEEMLNKAKSKGFKGNINYVCADIIQTQFKEGTFDFVVCYSSFPHFKDKQKALNEINRVLKTGGKQFICHTASRNSINAIHSQIPEVCNDLIPDEADMRKLLLQAGFTGIDIHDNADSFLATARK